MVVMKPLLLSELRRLILPTANLLLGGVSTVLPLSRAGGLLVGTATHVHNLYFSLDLIQKYERYAHTSI